MNRGTEFPQLPFPGALEPRAQMALLSSITSSPQSVSIALVSVLLLIFIARRVYSVYFGPLSQFPGPKLAAATLWYEFYYDVILQGHYTFKIKELHKKYGMLRPNSLPEQTANRILRTHYLNQPK